MAQGTPVHIAAQANEKVLSIMAFAHHLTEPLDCIGGVLLVFRGTRLKTIALGQYVEHSIGYPSWNIISSASITKVISL